MVGFGVLLLCIIMGLTYNSRRMPPFPTAGPGLEWPPPPPPLPRRPRILSAHTKITFAIANWFIDKANATGVLINQISLQKLMYIAHGWHLALMDGIPLVNEGIEAAPYGVSITGVREEVADKGVWSIHSPLGDETKYPRLDCIIHKNTIALLERVWETHRRFSPLELSSMTSKPGTPWSDMKPQLLQLKHDSSDLRIQIPDSSIQAYYNNLMKRVDS